MRVVSKTSAIEYFSRLPLHLQAPSLHPKYVFADGVRDVNLEQMFLIYEDSDGFFYHAVNKAKTPFENIYDLQSPYGYGGAVASTTSHDFLVRAQDQYRQWCKNNNIIVEFVRFHPLLENWSFSQHRVRDDRKTVWIDLQNDIEGNYTTRVRTAIRKADKNQLRVEWWDASQFNAEFPSIYKATMNRLGASDFYNFSLEYFNEIMNWDFASGAVCLRGNEVLGGAIFLYGPQIAEYHLSGSNDEGRKFGATNLLIHAGALRGKERGCNALHLGGGTSSNPDDPLLFFKQGFSALTSEFKTGSYIHLPSLYDSLRSEWIHSGTDNPKRVLFYT